MMLNLADLIKPQAAQPKAATEQQPMTVEANPALVAALRPEGGSSADGLAAIAELEAAICDMDNRCDGAISDDDIGFAGQHAFKGKKIAAKLENGQSLNKWDIQWAAKALPLYKNTQLKWIDWSNWNEKIAAAKREQERQWNSSINHSLENTGLNPEVTEPCPTTYNDCRPYFAQLREQMVAGKDWQFIRSLQSWSGIHTPGQQPHIVRLIKQYWPSCHGEFVIQGTSASTSSTDSENKPSNTNNKPESIFPENKHSNPCSVQEPTKPLTLIQLIQNQKTPKAAGLSLEPIQSIKSAASPHSEPPAPMIMPEPSETPATLADLIASQQQSAKVALSTSDDPEELLTVLEEIEDDKEKLSEFEILSLPETHRPKIAWEDLDDSQQEAVNGVIQEQFAGWTGAAGTGKTTVQQHVVNKLVNKLPSMNINRYTKEDREIELTKRKESRLVGSILLCAFTGRATQQIKKNFPRHFHSNIMTIHKALGFYPEFIDFENKDTGEVVSKRIFIPYYTESNRMPWKVIIIDESSMLGLHLWKQFHDAMEDDCRVYVVGDINQLPPVMDRSMFGFALNEWPSWELTHIHRQAEGSPIIENAWRVLNGEYPMKQPNFEIVTIETDSKIAERTLLKYVKGMTRGGFFNQQTDGIIVGMNGNKVDAAGYAIGRIPINRKLVSFFNPPPEDIKNAESWNGIRVIVTAGVTRETYAVGDKVMVTVNDNVRGLTNGMLGFITNITANKDFGIGDFDMGHIDPSELADRMAGLTSKDVTNVQENRGDEEDEEYGKRAASHIITVDFGSDIDGKPIVETFSTTGQVTSLVLAYAFTCHKSQGGEYPTVIIMCHSSQHRVLSREWLYTAITRAQERIVLICNNRGLSQAVNRQNIKGNNLKEKAQKFIEWSGSDIEKSPDLPQPRRIEA